jgi:ribosomal protein S18 acetylase RimI-like enzyme
VPTDPEVDDPRVLLRPDGRRILLTRARTRSQVAAAVASARREHPGAELFVTSDAADVELLAALRDNGFGECLRELHVRVPTDPSWHGLARDLTPDGVRLVHVEDVDLDALRRLDEEIREDIPGSDGWRWTLEGFSAEISGDDYDPALYRVAQEVDGGALVGLVRVWVRRGGPRLGCVGVLPPWRRTRLTWALLRSVAVELHRRGETTVVAEVSDRNTASLGLLARRGVRPYREEITLVLPVKDRSDP